jgi:hypothetical protein
MNSNYDALAGGVSAWGLGKLGARGGMGSLGALGTPPASTPATTGDGTMDFSIATGDDTGLLALLEDI